MLHFCTLFDSGYLSRGLAMYESLKSHCPQFTLYIFAFDPTSEQVLKSMALDNVKVISLTEFEDEQLLAIKPSRTRGEYCWTATSSTIRYVLNTYQADHCTYLDADLYFYSDPSSLIHKLGQFSVSIISHRYSKQYDQSKTSGIYCVQFMTFKNNADGIQVLEWWRNACLEWCYNRFEDGKFGDQKYLDDWLERFEGKVQEITHEGAGLAPWNMQQYELQSSDEGLVIRKSETKEEFKLIFTHFHQLKFLSQNRIDLCRYVLDPSFIEVLYKPYVTHLVKIAQKLGVHYPQKDFNGTQNPSGLKPLLVGLKRRLLREYHIFELEKFLS